MSRRSVVAAMAAVDRAQFLPEQLRDQAGDDIPLGIGHRQTNSQPTTVQLMLNWLDVAEGQKVLDVGAGSGWTTALLSYLVGTNGHVYAVEKIPELLRFGKANCERLGILNASFHLAGAEPGLPMHAPYDRILVSAAAQEIPNSLIEQLKPGGKLVLPVKSSVLEVSKLIDGQIAITEHDGFAFVPLV